MLILLQHTSINSNEITFKNLRLICDNHEKESLYIEFKSVPNCGVLSKNFIMNIYHEILAFTNQGGVIIFGISEERGRAVDHNFGVPKECNIKQWFGDLLESKNLEAYVRYHTVDHATDDSKEFLVATVSRTYKLIRDPDTFEAWIRVIGHKGPQAIRMNPEQLNRIFTTHDYVEETVNALFYSTVQYNEILAIPYDIEMLKQRVNLTDFLNDLEEGVSQEFNDLMNLPAGHHLSYRPITLTKQQYRRNVTRYDFDTPVECGCGSKNMNVELRIHSDGMVRYKDQYFYHFIAGHHRDRRMNELKVDLLKESIKNILLFLKCMYERFGVLEFEFIVNANDWDNIRRIGNAKRVLIHYDNSIFIRKIHFRMTMKSNEINQALIDEVLWSFIEEIARHLDRNFMDKQDFLIKFRELLD